MFGRASRTPVLIRLWLLNSFCIQRQNHDYLLCGFLNLFKIKSLKLLYASGAFVRKLGKSLKLLQWLQMKITEPI